MWFKMGMEVFSSAVVRDLSSAIKERDNAANTRVLAFIRLLSLAAAGWANDLQDAGDLGRLTGASPRQAQIVWETCIKHGVLRKGPQGYSVREWMIERGFFGNNLEKQSNKPQRAQAQAQSIQSRGFVGVLRKRDNE